ncbi:MAG: diaminopimelate epimerase [Alistipes sp.]|nr:diaminopimelate epimerase [Alistipes sp.]
MSAKNMGGMSHFEIWKCHGSGNDFIMVDAIREAAARDVEREAFARAACNRQSGIGSDGILFVDRDSDGVCVMDMLNPDGSHAEMCGNGIRCVARLAFERGYVTNGIIRSGGRDYRVRQVEAWGEGVEACAVDILLKRQSPDFAFMGQRQQFINEPIAELDAELRFTAMNPGNPHIVAAVERIDMARLEELGERVKGLSEPFPRGVNISMYEVRSKGEIFVATYERGAGITLSCGTAMTSSATAAVVMGLCDEGQRIEVRNSGGKVYCTTHLNGEEPLTTLEGNATFEWRGRASMCGNELRFEVEERSEEAACWQRFVEATSTK